jgi:hypothetical protein
MTTRYKFIDGSVIIASSPEEFVQKMRSTSWCPGEDDQDFMDLCSERGQKLEVDIRSDTAYNFLTDLIRCEVVTTEDIGEWN